MKTKAVLAVFAVALLSIVLASPAVSATATLVIQPGENWVALPLVPYNPAPTSILSGLDINGNLTRFDSSKGKVITYSASTAAEFGNLFLGEGYKIINPTSAAVTISYDGLADGVPGPDGRMTDMWISLPGSQYDNVDQGGMTWIGQPYAHATSVYSMVVTNGSEVKSIQQAISLGWIDPLWRGFDASTKTTFYAGLPQYGADETWFRAGHMYEITTHKDNLALILKSDIYVPEPASLAALLTGLGVLGASLRRKNIKK